MVPGTSAAEGVQLANPPRGPEVLAAVRRRAGSCWRSRMPRSGRHFAGWLVRALRGAHLGARAAAVDVLRDAGRIDPAERIVVPLTGSGLKNSRAVQDGLGLAATLLELGRREPLLEGRAGELRARVGERGALRVGLGVRVVAPGERPSSRISIESPRLAKSAAAASARRSGRGPATSVILPFSISGSSAASASASATARAATGCVCISGMCATPSWIVHPTS